MGWYGEYGTRTATEVGKNILEDLAKNEKVRVLKASATSYGRNLWIAMEAIATGEQFIAFYLIRPGKEASYKPMDESMGPCEKDCPLGLLDMTEAKMVATQFNTSWRAKVRAYHAEKKASSSKEFAPGDKVSIYGRPYTIVSKHKRSWLVKNALGLDFKVSADKIELQP